MTTQNGSNSKYIPVTQLVPFICVILFIGFGKMKLEYSNKMKSNFSAIFMDTVYLLQAIYSFLSYYNSKLLDCLIL